MDFFVTGVAPSVHAWRDWHHKCGSKYNSIGCITACSASRNILIEAALRDFTHICIRRCQHSSKHPSLFRLDWWHVGCGKKGEEKSISFMYWYVFVINLWEKEHKYWRTYMLANGIFENKEKNNIIAYKLDLMAKTACSIFLINAFK
jgi:hypothetical protein